MRSLTSLIKSNSDAQVNHFVARFTSAMKNSDFFKMDNLGNRIDDRPAAVWKIYDSFDEMINANRPILASGDRTHCFSFLRSLDMEAFAVALIQ